MVNKYEVLFDYFGYQSFRPGQEELIDKILLGRDVLGVMPTSAGKSLCYQIPAMIMDGISIVVSPLISLMTDQVSALRQAGIAAGFINSTLSASEIRDILRDAGEGQYKILYVAPERLENTDFLDFCQSVKIAMVAVDEAHCVSQWGHDFRPSYRNITRFIEALPSRPIVSAFTATATPEVRADIEGLLKMNDAHCLVTGFDRSNLYFEVQHPVDKLKSLLEFLIEREDLSGIVYCARRMDVEQVCEELLNHGYSATRYHAGLSDEERKTNQDDFIYDRSSIMVATNAFGMGIDKSNVSYVVHYNMPKNIESYYQEAGRAGRDGEPAVCLLLYASQDVQTGRYFIEHSYIDSKYDMQMREIMRDHDFELLKRMTWYCTTSDCLRGYILKYFSDSAPVHCDYCSNCDTQFETVNATQEARKIVLCVMEICERGNPFGRTIVANTLNGSKEKRVNSLGLNSVRAYGSLRSLSVKRIVDIIDHMVEKGWLEQTASSYPVIVLTDKSRDIFDSELHIKIPKERKKVGKTVKVSQRTVAEVADSAAAKVDMVAAARTDLAAAARAKTAAPNQEDNNLAGYNSAELYEILVALRRKLADDAGVPAYIVFSNATLTDMCQKLPRTPDEFLSVSGVGRAKLAAYCDVFLEAITDYLVTLREF
ncbi:MAG: DNA helicase RecQ [Coriobacteriia bacterium]|nr:DNA helicase RecQ [Coriobacteriia bacterium]